LKVWRGISRDRNLLVNVWYQAPPDTAKDPLGDTALERHINIQAIKAVVPTLDTGVNDALPIWGEAVARSRREPNRHMTLLNLVDRRVPPEARHMLSKATGTLPLLPETMSPSMAVEDSKIIDSWRGAPLNLMAVQDGDGCPRCDGVLRLQKALELGHTFYLGTRYSQPLAARITLPPSRLAGAAHDSATLNAGRSAAIEMGCHGIGVSRLLGAVAEHLADEKGLNWPLAIAPYEAVIISSPEIVADAIGVYDLLTQGATVSGRPLDAVLDDRSQSLVRKMKDADLIGYPVLVILGRAWADGKCEVQCRQLGVKQGVELTALPDFVSQILARLE
jgi:prolyl-tRNA synthetase